MKPTRVTPTAEQEVDEIEIFVSNIICNFRVARSIDLKELARRGINSYYDPLKNNVRIESFRPKFYATIWQSGKVVCAGAEDTDQAYYNAKYVTKLLLNFGFKAKLRNYRIINVMASLKLPFRICLPELSVFIKGIIYVEEEEDSRATLYMDRFQSCFKIFETGRVTLMTTSIEFLNQAIDRFSDEIYKFSVWWRNKREKANQC